MATVHLVRHCAHAQLGRVLSGRLPGLALTVEGRAQAARLAAGFAGVGPMRVQASPRERASETAAALAGVLGGEVETVPALDELDFGEWTGRSYAELDGDPRWRTWNAARGAATAPGGESMAAAVARAAGHITALAEVDATVVCVTHCDVIRGVVADAIGLPLDRLLAFDVDPGSVTTLAVERWGVRLKGLNREKP